MLTARYYVLLLFCDLIITGAQRSRMLTTLYKDERCSTLAAYSILQKMYFERLIRSDEVFFIATFQF